MGGFDRNMYNLLKEHKLKNNLKDPYPYQSKKLGGFRIYNFDSNKFNSKFKFIPAKNRVYKI